MAEVLDSYDDFGVGPSSAWWHDEWLDGRIWKLTEGDDFPTSRTAMREKARRRAKELGCKVRVSCKQQGFVILQAYDLPTVRAVSA